jgi:hypothetical protein
MVDARDLKSLGSNFPCRFKSGRPHHMSHFECDPMDNDAGRSENRMVMNNGYGGALGIAPYFNGFLFGQDVVTVKDVREEPHYCGIKYRPSPRGLQT